MGGNILAINARTIEGKRFLLNAPIVFEYYADRYVPCDSLEVTVPVSDNLNYGEEFCEVSAVLNGAKIFDGIVDTQILSYSDKGRLLKLSCRNKTALLLDNEVKPSIYFQLTSKQLFEKYAAPYGVVGTDFPFEVKQNFMQVKKGYSNWRVIQEFCLLAYKALPYINRKNILVLNPLTSNNIHLSKSSFNGKRYSQISYKTYRHKQISRIHMKTATETYGYYYGVVIDNKVALNKGIMRERYYHPISKITVNAKGEAERIIKDSNRSAYETEVVIPEIIDVQIGDSISIAEPILNGKSLFVSRICCRADSTNGIYTRLTLSDKIYA